MKNGTQVKPVHISKTIDRSVDVSVNPYKEALTQEVDGHLHEEPSLEMKKCDLAWSILSTVIDYTTIRDNSPYVEMKTSNLYNKLQEDEQLISGDSSDQWDERFEEVTCARSFCLHLGVWFCYFFLQLCQRSLFLWLCINVLQLWGML